MSDFDDWFAETVRYTVFPVDPASSVPDWQAITGAVPESLDSRPRLGVTSESGVWGDTGGKLVIQTHVGRAHLRISHELGVGSGTDGPGLPTVEAALDDLRALANPWLLTLPPLSRVAFAALGPELGRTRREADSGDRWRNPRHVLWALTGRARGRVHRGSGGGVSGPLRVVPLAGGPSRTLVERAYSAGWSDDGWVYFTAADLTIRRVRESGGPDETVTEVAEGERFHIFPQPLPGGRHLLFGVWRQLNGSDAAVWSVDLETRERKLITPGTNPRYTATGHLLFGTFDGRLIAAPFNARRAELTGDAVPVAEGLTTDPIYGNVFYSVSGHGSLVYLAGAAAVGERRLVVVDLEGNERTLTLTPRNLGEVAWSPDGRSVVYQSDDNIYTYNVELGTTPRQLTFDGTNIRPVFSADGTRVAFSSTRNGTDGFDLFMKTLGDDAPARSLITLAGVEFPTQWPSDTLIVFE